MIADFTSSYSTSPSVDFVEEKSMNASFFVPFSAKLRQSETCYVLLMSDVSSKMILYHPLARISFVILSRMRSAINRFTLGTKSVLP